MNTIAPFASTPALDYWFDVDPDAARTTVDAIPLRRIGDPERDIGRAVVFLVGPDAAYVTGMTMPLDGGQAYFDDEKRSSRLRPRSDRLTAGEFRRGPC